MLNESKHFTPTGLDCIYILLLQPFHRYAVIDNFNDSNAGAGTITIRRLTYLSAIN